MYSVKYSLIYTLLVLILITIIQKQKYYKYYPTLPIYPSNNNEIKIVEKYVNNRNKDIIEFFYLTNQSIISAYIPHVKESYKVLKEIIMEVRNEILLLKYIINRARPKQINKNLKSIYSNTALSPSYPAGHAYQAYYLSKKLSKIYPNKSKLFENIAKKCDLCRVCAGLHYPSDGQFSKYLVDLFYK